MNLVFVGDPCCDHSPSSGYHQICSIFPDASWLSERHLLAGQVTWYRRPPPTRRAARLLFHVFYGDFSPLPPMLRAHFPDATIVSSIHRPIDRVVADATGRRSLGATDAVFTVSTVQAEHLTQLGVAASVHVIPHGVWTERFRSASATAPIDRSTVLLVGNHLRDWNTAARALDLLAKQAVVSVIVGAATPRDTFADTGYVKMLPRVSETQLVDLYDNAAALFLPVVDATASNALLEAMAAGCPIVCPELPALVDDYLGDRSDTFAPGRADLASERLMSYIREPRRRADRSRALTKRSEVFDWLSLRPRYLAAYGEILARTDAATSARVTLGRPKPAAMT